MNYLSYITSTVLSSAGVSTFPFTIGERIPGLDHGESIWDIKEGVKKDDGALLTLFIFDSTLPPLQPGNKDRRAMLQLARNALKKLKTIRHPDVVKYIDSAETDTHVYIATERVRPLPGVLRDWAPGGSLTGAKGKGKENWIGWGVRSITVSRTPCRADSQNALSFLNASPLNLHHAYLLPTTIFITPAMEWRLGGFELLTGKDDSAGVLWGLGSVAPGDVGERSAPEVRKSGWTVLRDADPSQSDTYLLALLLFSLYNPSSPLPNLAAQPTPSSAGTIPRALFPLWKRMLNPNPRTRLSTTAFIAEASSAGFWSDNPLTSLVEALDGFELKSEGDKLAILRTIKDAASAGGLPGPFMLYRVLPSLLHSISLPTAPSGAMLPLVLDLGKLVPPADYGKMVLDPVIKLYASPDRGTRMALLDGLSEYADKLDTRIVSDRIWPHLITGFADTVPVIREATVKAIYPISSKLNDRLLNNDLLRLLAKTQTDTEPSIRTNTCILLGRLAPILGPNTKKKVLVPAFARSLKDPFVHARVAGLMAFMATVECFDRDDLAGKVIPNMAFAMVDKEKLVRDQAFKAMNMFMKRIEGMVAQMPETISTDDRSPFSLGPTTTAQASSAGGASQTGLVNSATGAAGALAGWAISSLTKQLAATEVHSTMSAQPGLAPPSNGASTYGTPAGSNSASPRLSSEGPSVPGGFAAPAPVQARPSATKASFGGAGRAGNSAGAGAGAGLKLGAKKTAPKASVADTLVAEWEEDEGDGVENAWGTEDLIDVNADDDDWAAFESAPVPEIVVPPPQSYYTPPAPAAANGRSASTSQAPKAFGSTASRAAPAPAPAPVPVSQPKPPAPPIPAASDGWDDDTSPISAAAGVASPPRPSSAAGLPSMASMSKEEKDKEMARRRDERKAVSSHLRSKFGRGAELIRQRIAAMKGGKK